MKRALLICSTAALLLACGTDVTTLPADSGILRVQLTDAPFSADSVAKVEIHVVRVDARIADADSATAAAGAADDSASVGGWQTIARPNAVFDLLTLRNGKFAAIGQDTLKAGTYRGFRFVIDPSRSSVTLKNGMVLTSASNPSVTFPSAARSGIKVNLTQGIVVGDDSTSTVRIDFDLENSFVLRGNSIERNGLLFKPVVKAASVKNDSTTS